MDKTSFKKLNWELIIAVIALIVSLLALYFSKINNQIAERQVQIDYFEKLPEFDIEVDYKVDNYSTPQILDN